MWFFKKKKVEPKKTLVVKAVDQLDKIKKSRFNKRSLEKLNKVIRIFLKEEYNISRALTTQELNKVIKTKIKSIKIRTKFIGLTEEIETEEYKSTKPFTKKKLDDLIEKTKVVFNLTRQKYPSSKPKTSS